MIGLSISRCISDISEGSIELKDVEKIIGRTAAIEDGLEKLIKTYRESSWQEFPDAAERLFRQLLAEGKIEQPRLIKDDHFPELPNNKIWVETENQITWYDETELYLKYSAD